LPATRGVRTNAEWSALTRLTLLRSAREAFASNGYERTSLDAIAATASATKGAIYHHYRDKRELFRAVVEDVQRSIVEQVERSARNAPSSFEGLQRGCEAFLDSVLEQGVSRIVLIDAPSVLGWTTWRAIDEAIGAPSLRTGLDVAMNAGEMVRLDTRALATLISGALNEAALTIVESSNPKRARLVVIKTLRRLLEGLRT
jgi:AcrR family transcriptional regulator